MLPRWLENSSKLSYMLQLKPEFYIYYKKVQPFISSMSQIKHPIVWSFRFPTFFFLKSGLCDLRSKTQLSFWKDPFAPTFYFLADGTLAFFILSS